MTFSTIDRRRIRQREREEKATEQDDATILSTIMEHYDGRRWMHDKFVKGNIFGSCFNENPVTMAYNCGVHDEAKRDFFKVVALCPDEYIQMMKEAAERDRAERGSKKTREDEAREKGNRDEAERIGIIASEETEEAEDE